MFARLSRLLMLSVFGSACSSPGETGLIGFWKLQADSKDYSGNNHHGVSHDSSQATGGGERRSFIEVPSFNNVKLGTGDFSISTWVHLPEQHADIGGDILELYDPSSRRGITFSINSSAGGYQGFGNDHHVYFGVDNGTQSQWQDCGRPNPTSNYISNSLTVYKGNLYAAITGAQKKEDWAHVYRYDGGQQWTDCGRVGTENTTGVVPLIVHNGDLYAATSTYDWTRVQTGNYSPGRVYRYRGGTDWEMVSGWIDSNATLTTLSSYKGKLYVGGGPHTWAVYSQDTGTVWKPSKIFPKEGPHPCFPHASRVYRDKLFVAFQNAYSFDGSRWTYAGVPSPPESTLQTHSFSVYRGNLIAGTWPLAKVSKYLGGEQWEVFGRIGSDGTEVNALVVYNGKLYGGSIPRAEVARYDDRDSTWTTLKQFYSPAGWTPVPPVENGGNPTDAEVNEWTRVTSMTVYDGKLFAGIASCTSSPLDAPADIRGRVFSMEAGKNISYDDDIGTGWKHIAIVKKGGKLNLYINGKLVKSSSAFNPSEYDIPALSLRIGFGQTDYFSGKIAELRMYTVAINDERIRQLASEQPQ